MISTNLLPGPGIEVLPVGPSRTVSDKLGSLVALAPGSKGTATGAIFPNGAHGELDAGGTPGMIGYAGGLDLPESGLSRQADTRIFVFGTRSFARSRWTSFCDRACVGLRVADLSCGRWLP